MWTPLGFELPGDLSKGVSALVEGADTGAKFFDGFAQSEVRRGRIGKGIQMSEQLIAGFRRDTRPLSGRHKMFLSSLKHIEKRIEKEYDNR